jgi:hypothetical protein
MKRVELSQGYVALVDDADYEQVVAAGPWHVRIDRSGNRYAKHSTTARSSVFLHTLLTGWLLVDHANGDGLDNRRANLRPASRGQNSANARLRRDNRSGLKGVYHHSPGRWKATCNRKYLGLFPSPEAAARAYDDAAVLAFGEYARLNFPKEIAA